MLFPKTNIEKKLITQKRKEFDITSWEQQVQSIFEKTEEKNDQIIETLEKGNTSEPNDFIFDLLDYSKIHHIDQIKKICIDYRLRFLDTKYFKGKFPKEAIRAITEIENTHGITLTGFKIIAPSKLFKLANADDPLLFVPMGNNYYYLVHTWGKDLHPFRKTIMWFFKSFENLLILTFLVSLLITFMVPEGLFSKESNTSEFIMIFLFMFKSVAAVVLFYGFALGKNFNTAIWDSKYFNA
ncbi:hypothetical protein [Aquimarina sp. 2201CG14-23]|uniref:hypothetical protein n=1 Tax=Aquimarina mycalae TaxID=3040073 RepID=UPI002477EE81|nr:hypothetical protein [Aquimarina sp. 2201CG14-23]MDH7444047.1 hypothetical protein [Aquimarina sp. 2201CG14-23]